MEFLILKPLFVDTSITGDNVSNKDNVCDHEDNAVIPESSGPRHSSRIKWAPDRFTYDRSPHALDMYVSFSSGRGECSIKYLFVSMPRLCVCFVFN